jgi:hypothetical protein
MLTADPTVHAHIFDILDERDGKKGPPSTPLPRFTLRRALNDVMRIESDALSIAVGRPFYKVGQAVDVRVGARSASGHSFDARSVKISVRVEQSAHLGQRVAAKALHVHVDPDRPGSWIGRLRAPAPGSYRVSAAASHRWLAPFRVYDFFEVDASK